MRSSSHSFTTPQYKHRKSGSTETFTFEPYSYTGIYTEGAWGIPGYHPPKALPFSIMLISYVECVEKCMGKV